MSLKKNFSYNLLLTISNILFPIATFPLVSRTIGPEGVGTVQFVTTFVQYFILIAALGIPMYGVREVAKVASTFPKLKQLVLELTTLNLITSLVLLGGYYILVWSVPSLQNDLIFYQVGSVMLVTAFCNVEWLFSGLEQFKLIAVRSVTVKCLSLILIYCCLDNENDTITYLLIVVGGSALNNIWNFVVARRFFKPSGLMKINLSIHLRPLFYTFSTIAAISVYAMLDTLLLGFMKGYKDVGYYTAAIRITKPIIPILTSLGTVLIPKISNAFDQHDDLSVKRYAEFSMNFVVLLGVPICLGTIFLSKELLILFCGQEFLYSDFCTKVFSLVVLIIGVSNVFAIQLLTPAGKDKYVTYSVLVGLLCNLVLNYVLISHYSYSGAAVANLVTEFLVMFMFGYYTKRFFDISIDFQQLVVSTVVSCFFYPILLLARKIFVEQTLFVCVFTVAASSTFYLLVQSLVIKNEILLKQIENLRKKLVV